eukprot:g3006.t1
MRQASQCLGRVIRSKRDYGVMIFADQRYARSDKRSKIPDWIRHFLEPGHVFMASDLAVEAAGNFLLQMSQPFEPRTLDRVNHEEKTGVGASVLTPQALQELQAEGSKASDSKEMEKLRGDWGRRWAKHHVTQLPECAELEAASYPEDEAASPESMAQRQRVAGDFFWALMDARRHTRDHAWIHRWGCFCPRITVGRVTRLTRSQVRPSDVWHTCVAGLTL